MSERERLEKILSAVEAAGARFPVLVTLCRVQRGGLPFSEPTLSRIAAHFGKSAADVRALAGWVRALIDPPPHTVLFRCVSVSCTANGADVLHREFQPEFESSGSPLDCHTVHCLDQCDRGPSMAIGSSIYVGAKEEVVEDERPWREAPFSHSS